MNHLVLILVLSIFLNCISTSRSSDTIEKSIMRPIFENANQPELNGKLNIKMEVGSNNIEGEYSYSYYKIPILGGRLNDSVTTIYAIEDAISKSKSAAFYHISTTNTEERGFFNVEGKTIVIGRPIYYRDAGAQNLPMQQDGGKK